jgi:hypothetical protein
MGSATTTGDDAPLTSGVAEALVLEAYLDLCHAKDGKARVEKALSTLLRVLRCDRDDQAAGVGIVVALVALGQPAKAKPQLRRATTTTTAGGRGGKDNARAAEAAAVLLSASLSKTDAAEARRVLVEHVRSCAGAVRAHSSLGELCTQAGRHSEARAHYAEAWKHCYQADADVLQRLCASSLRAGKYVEAASLATRLKRMHGGGKIAEEFEMKAKKLIRSGQ